MNNSQFHFWGCQITCSTGFLLCCLITFIRLCQLFKNTPHHLQVTSQTYAVMACLSSSIVYDIKENTLSFKYPQRKYSRGGRLGERCAQTEGHLKLMILSQNVSPQVLTCHSRSI